MRDGDLINVFSISPKFENAVTLRGNVAAPLRYPYREGMRIRDLIPEKEALITPEYYLRRNFITRSDILNSPLAPGEAQANRQTIRQSTGQGQQQLVDQVRLLTAEINWDYAVIERLSERDLSTVLLPFNLGKAVIEGDASQNLPLRPGDVVTIFSTRDLAVPVARQTKLVRLEGEFANPGVYRVEPGETLRQFVVRLGGVSQQAYLFGAEFTRESTRAQQEKNLEDAINRMEREVQRFAVTRAQNVVNPEDGAAIKQQAESQQLLIARLRQLKSSGRIVLGLQGSSRIGELPDIVLEDGDRLHIPARPSMVTVFGSVYNENAYLYRPAKRVADYLAQAGGPTKDADTSSIYVLRADGSVLSRRQSGRFLFIGALDSASVNPGDSIIVPEELDKTSFTRILKDFTQIFYQFGLGAAAIKVLK